MTYMDSPPIKFYKWLFNPRQCRNPLRSVNAFTYDCAYMYSGYRYNSSAIVYTLHRPTVTYITTTNGVY